MTGRSQKVFLVEDNLEISRMYERAFRLHGYDIEMVYDGETALQTLISKEEVPDVIVADAVIPHLSGYELLKQLRTNERYAKVPIVILTNSYRKEREAEFISAGADLFLVKMDHQFKQIIDQVEQLIGKSRETHS